MTRDELDAAEAALASAKANRDTDPEGYQRAAHAAREAREAWRRQESAAGRRVGRVGGDAVGRRPGPRAEES